jgi:hypothetical protein
VWKGDNSTGHRALKRNVIAFPIRKETHEDILKLPHDPSDIAEGLLKLVHYKSTKRSLIQIMQI